MPFKPLNVLRPYDKQFRLGMRNMTHYVGNAEGNFEKREFYFQR